MWQRFFSTIDKGFSLCLMFSKIKIRLSQVLFRVLKKNQRQFIWAFLLDDVMICDNFLKFSFVKVEASQLRVFVYSTPSSSNFFWGENWIERTVKHVRFSCNCQNCWAMKSATEWETQTSVEFFEVCECDLCVPSQTIGCGSHFYPHH